MTIPTAFIVRMRQASLSGSKAFHRNPELDQVQEHSAEAAMEDHPTFAPRPKLPA